MRSRGLLFSAALMAFLFAPAIAAAQGMSFPFFGPIVPEAVSYCPASFASFIDIVNRIISFAITIIILFLAPLVIAYAGFLFVVNPVNPAGKERAKSILWDLTKGVVIALAAWLIVDLVFTVLTPGGPFKQKWYAIVTGTGDPCLKQAGALQTLNQSDLSVQGTSVTGVQYLAPASGNCSSNALISYGIDPAIANTMSCIAQNESSCNLTASNKTSSAFGLFQIVNGYNDTGHNLNFPECTAAAKAAGYAVSGDLNCSKGVVAGGSPNPNNITLYNACRAASANATCNAKAAQWLYTNRGGFKNWEVAPKCGV